MKERDIQARIDRMNDDMDARMAELGREARADFRQAFADVIGLTGGDRIVEFMERLAQDEQTDSWTSPDLLHDMAQHCPGSEVMVFDRYAELSQERIDRKTAEIDSIDPKTQTLGQKAVQLARATWRGFSRIHL